MTLLDQIDRAVDGLCPCGAEPRDGSAYCGPDCEPTHISEDTDAPGSGTPTPMRWRPDLVTAADDTDIIPLGSETHGYAGWFNAQVYERISAPDTWHLRLDDGHRFVGVDLTDVGGRQDPITEDLVGRVREAWQRLERELTDSRRVVPDNGDAEDPWGDVMPTARRWFNADTPMLRRELWDQSLANGDQVQTSHAACRSYHNQPVQAVDVPAGNLAAVALAARESFRPIAEAAEQFLQQWGGQLSDWQREIVEQMYAGHIIHPRRFGRSPLAQPQLARVGFRPLVNARQAAILAQHGLSEGVHFLRYADPQLADVDEPRSGCRGQDPDEPPTDPRARALWLRKHRGTGPPTDRLDGRRRRRR